MEAQSRPQPGAVPCLPRSRSTANPRCHLPRARDLKGLLSTTPSLPPVGGDGGRNRPQVLRTTGQRPQPLDQGFRVLCPNPDTPHLVYITVIEPRRRVGYHRDPQVSLACFVERGPRTVGEVTSADDNGVDTESRKVSLERCRVESPPPRLEHEPLVRPYLLQISAEQLLCIGLDSFSWKQILDNTSSIRSRCSDRWCLGEPSSSCEFTIGPVRRNKRITWTMGRPAARKALTSPAINGIASAVPGISAGAPGFVKSPPVRRS